MIAVRTTTKLQVGCPIRRSLDQSPFPAPQCLSQGITSFIASCCQGIHQTPFSRLIRSRRRQALLRDGGSYPSTHLLGFCSEVISTHAPCLGRGGRRQRVQRSQAIRRPSRSVYFDLERLSLVVLPRGAPLEDSCPRAAPTWRTLSAPHSERTQKRLVFLLSSRCQYVTCHDLAIGQEGSSADEPANRIGRRTRSWWSLPGSNR